MRMSCLALGVAAMGARGCGAVGDEDGVEGKEARSAGRSASSLDSWTDWLALAVSGPPLIFAAAHCFKARHGMRHLQH